MGRRTTRKGAGMCTLLLVACSLQRSILRASGAATRVKKKTPIMEPLVQWFRGGPKKEDRPALQLQEVAWNRTTPPTVLEINRTNDDQLSAGQRSLTFVVVSDTHDKHEKLVLPDADVLLHWFANDLE